MYRPPYGNLNFVHQGASFPDEILNGSLPKKDSRSGGWIAIGALIALTVLCLFAGGSKILHLLFPAASLLVGIYLYYRDPVLYQGFTWWIWFLVAFIRRLADYRSGYTESSPMLLAPYLVSFISILTVIKRINRTEEDGTTAFLLPLLATVYGLLIGCIMKTPFLAFRGFLDWAAPICFGFHLLVNWRAYPQYRQNCQRVFFWGILVMSIYGIIQFLELPEWDVLWLKETGMASASGSAEEGGVRIWSTMHSAEPFAAVMAGGLLILLSSANILGIPVSIVGYVAILICRVRSGWIGWVAGLLSFFAVLNVKSQFRLLATALVLILTVTPLLTMEEFSDKVFNRLDTLSDIQNDDSASGRQESFNLLIGKSIVNIIGDGLERDSMDNSILAMLFYLGWIGTIPFMYGLVTLFIKIFTIPPNHRDVFSIVGRGVVMSTIVRFPVNGPHLGPSGVLLWSFLAFGIAAERYRKQQQLNQINHQILMSIQAEEDPEMI